MAGIEKIAVSINFFSPRYYLTRRNKRAALKMRKPLPMEKLISLRNKSIIEMITIRKSN